MTAAAGDPPHFDRIAGAYDLLVNESKRWANEREALARWLDRAGEGRRRVLDMGCGTGFHARRLAAHLNAEVVGAEPAAAMLAAARRKEHAAPVRWVNARAEAPPPGPFDLILLLGNTLSLIASPGDALRALRGVAAAEALLVIQTLDYDALRAGGGKHVRREGGGVSIEKRLTPLPQSSNAAATLMIIVRDQDGEILHQLTHDLIHHPTRRLVEQAAETGWELAERRRSYADASAGADRILVFRAR